MSSPPKMSPPTNLQQQPYPIADELNTPSSIRSSEVVKKKAMGEKPGLFTKERYRPLFDVNEKVLGKRLFKSIVFCGGPFYGSDRSDENNKPDLYGPFWIIATLILVMGVLGTFTRNGGDLDMKRVSYATMLFFIGWLLPSFVLYWFLRWFNAKRGMSNIMSLYGYSFFIYIPMAFFTLLPINNIDLITISIAAGVSTLFVVKNVYCYFIMEQEHYSVFTDIEHTVHTTSDGETVATTTTNTVQNEYIEEDGSNHAKPHKKIGLILMIGVIAVHLLIALLAYFMFFRVSDPEEPQPTPDPTPDPTPAPNVTSVDFATKMVLRNFHTVLGYTADDFY
eukprot:UN01170